MSGGGILNQTPSSSIYVSGNQVTISGNSVLNGALYAPLSNVSVTGNASVAGAVTRLTVTGSGNAAFQCD